MSRFFATGDTTTESEYSESDVDIKDTKTAKKATVSRLIDSSDSDSDAPREIKSAKEKKVDELEKICTLVHNYLKRNEIAKTAETFDLLQKQLIKSAAIIKVSGVPPCFFKALLAIEEKTVDLSEDKETLSALAPASQKAVDPLKTKVRKIIALYAKQITAYKKAPLVSDEEEDDESEDDESEDDESEDDEPVVQKKAAPAAVKAVAPARKSAFSMGSDSEEDDEESEDEVPVKKAPVTKAAPTSRFGFDDESESEEESDEEDYAGDTFVDSDDDDDWARAEETASEEESEDDFDYDNIKLDASKITRDFWVKKANHKDTNKKVQAKPKAAPKTRAQPKAKSSKFDDDDEKKVEAAPREEMTPQNLNKRLREIVANRGKRSTDNQAILAELLDLETQTKEVPTIVKILTLVLLTHFDIVLQHGSSMSVSVWRNVVGIVQRMLTILEQNPTVRLAEDDAYQDFQIYDQTDDEHGISLENFIDEDEREEYLNRRQRLRDENEAQRSKLSKLRAAERAAESSSEYTFVEGSLYSYVWKLSNEYFKSLQQADHLSSDFIARLREQPRLIELFKATRAYYQRTEKPVLETRVLHLWIEYEYYFYQPKYDVMGKTEEVPVSIVDELADILIKCDDARIRTRALLFQLYFWAIHNRYDAARDRYLASHIQESINDHDIETRVLYNRTVAQLGLAAFRQGDYRATVSALHELFANPSRTRELLAQGVCIPKTTEPREDDIAEARRRIYPYHMFIDIDLLEAVNLISCTIVEIPIIVECGWHQLRRVVSRSFRKLYLPFSQERSRHVYLQAETTKDAILIAAEALEKGRWAQCYESIRSLRFWTFIPQADLVKKQLEVRIKREALRTYLLTSGSNYISITMDILVSMFDLPESDIIRITSKMMHSDLISGTWDISGTSKIMTIQSTPQNTLQKSCFQWVDKVQQFSERVERLYDVRYPANKK